MFLPCPSCLVDIYACAKGPREGLSDSAAGAWGQANSNGVFLLENMAKVKRNVNSMPEHGTGRKEVVGLHPYGAPEVLAQPFHLPRAISILALDTRNGRGQLGIPGWPKKDFSLDELATLAYGKGTKA